MRNLDYYVRLTHSRASDNNAYLSLIQQDVSGGRITRQEIDAIKNFSSATEISISGLTQDTFEYFVENYGSQFKAIIFWKCPLIQDLRKMALLDRVEYVVYFWNQRAERLWDFSKTKALRGFCFDDFTRMHDISELSEAPSLEELHFGDRVWRKYIVNTLQPLRECTLLRSLSFSAKKILDEKIEPIAYLKKLEQLSFPSNQFSTEQVAWLKAHLPNAVTSESLQAYRTIEKPIKMGSKNKDAFVAGKRKPVLDSIQEKDRLAKYVGQFNVMHQWYLDNPTALPNDYHKAA